MLILFDNSTPRGLARFLMGHSVQEARSRGWDELSSGDLIDAAERAGFEVLVTTDKNIRHQQNLTSRKTAEGEIFRNSDLAGAFATNKAAACDIPDAHQA